MKAMTYGYFPGGDYDPRRFEPDRETNTPAEIAAWRNACEAWNRGKHPVLRQNGVVTQGAFLSDSELGMGVYEVDVGALDPVATYTAACDVRLETVA